MSKYAIHMYQQFSDEREFGQTTYEYLHTTTCKRIGKQVTNDPKKVTCKKCLQAMGLLVHPLNKWVRYEKENRVG